MVSSLCCAQASQLVRDSIIQKDIIITRSRENCWNTHLLDCTGEALAVDLPILVLVKEGERHTRSGAGIDLAIDIEQARYKLSVPERIIAILHCTLHCTTHPWT